MKFVLLKLVLSKGLLEDNKKNSVSHETMVKDIHLNTYGYKSEIVDLTTVTSQPW